MAITDDELDGRLRLGRLGMRGEVLPAAVVSGLISDTRATARRRTLRMQATAATGAVVIVVSGIVAGPATADIVQKFLAETVLNPRSDNVFSSSDEWINTGASDFPEYAATTYPQWLPLAPGQTQQEVIAQVVAQNAATAALTRAISVRRNFENVVYGAWMGEWIAAHDAGDPARMTTAITVLKDAPTWPAMVTTDGGGVTKLMAGFVAEMADGKSDVAQAAAQYDGNPSWDGIDRGDLIAQLFCKYTPEAL